LKTEKLSSLKIKKMFSQIAFNYDRANKFITLGMDSRWRRKLVKWSSAPKGGKVLDCATGTGNLALEFYKALGSKSQIIGIDFCENMINKAREKKQIQFQLADVHKLPFPDKTFDVCSMAYGLRNVEDPIAVLKEMARVTKKGGALMILETGDKPVFFLYPFFYLYFRYIVPFIGGWFTGHKLAYEYLQKSSRKFPSRKKLLSFLMELNHFGKCEYKALFFGASFIYKAQVL